MSRLHQSGIHEWACTLALHTCAFEGVHIVLSWELWLWLQLLYVALNRTALIILLMLLYECFIHHFRESRCSVLSANPLKLAFRHVPAFPNLSHSVLWHTSADELMFSLCLDCTNNDISWPLSIGKALNDLYLLPNNWTKERMIKAPSRFFFPINDVLQMLRSLTYRFLAAYWRPWYERSPCSTVMAAELQ